jgi:hypothetical protein
MNRILIKNASVVTVDSKRQVYLSAYVLIENGLFVDV